MIKFNVKKIPITVLTIRLNGASKYDKCRFDVLGNGVELTEALTFGELVEYLIVVFRYNIFGASYTSDYPNITINDSLESF